MIDISIVLPVKNGALHLNQCMNSILNQSFENFELLIFDDDSIDHTLQIIKTYKDSRIKLFSGKLGFIANLNKGIEYSRSKFIARMDADDIMAPSRLEIQLERMENLNIDVCASWLQMFGAYTQTYIKTYGLKGFVENPLAELVQRNCIAHPSVMIRRSFLLENNLKYDNYPFVEDYKLWFEIAKKGGVFYIEPQTLLNYRVSSAQVSIANESKMIEAVATLQIEIEKYISKIKMKNEPPLISRTLYGK
jgi:glycosyltransferase involved in cell wall biosynthesis